MVRAVSLAGILAVLITLCSCTSDGSVKIKFDTKEYITDTMSIKAQIPKFSGMPDREFENTLNDGYEKEIGAWIDEFTAEVDANTVSEFDLQNCIRYNKNNFISIVSEIYTFTGGAHGTTSWAAKNIDVSQSKILLLGDLFKPEEDYKAVINRTMLEMAENNKEDYGTLWEQPILSDKQQSDFYIEDGKLVIYYSPYELSYYARGFVEFPIPLENLQSYLKDEYKILI